MKAEPCWRVDVGGGGREEVVGGGGLLDAGWVAEEGGMGTAHGCGGGGPLSADEACVVRVGCGGGFATNGVGAGTAAAPGWAGAYGERPPLAAVVTPASVFVVLVGSSAIVCGVVPNALLGVTGSSMCSGMGGMVANPSLVCPPVVCYALSALLLR